jgi:hypothetical protein
MVQGALCGGGCRDCHKPTPKNVEWCADCVLAYIRERDPDFEPADLEPIADADRVADGEAAQAEADDQVETVALDPDQRQALEEIAAAREPAEVTG